MSQIETFVGVDAATGRKPFTFVALDPGRKLRTVGSGAAADVLSFLAGLNSALVAVSPPWKGGKTLDGLGLSLPGLRLGGLRPDRLPQPPLLEGEPRVSCPAWLKESLGLVARLEQLDYQPYPAGQAARQWLEAPAETGFRALLGVEPFAANILEGRIQRQLALADLDLPVPDAMEFFEEVTRFRLLHSHLPYACVLPQAEINAWLAAACAWLALHQPDCVRAAGSAEDGLVYLPLPKA